MAKYCPHLAQALQRLYQIRICLRMRLMANDVEVKRMSVPCGKVSLPWRLTGSMNVIMSFNFLLIKVLLTYCANLNGN